ncbi:MAG: helix-turn-helix domain-containing protein [Prevotella sp.]|nr:helix-turn-helix domain-containing protein [Prevotella sp.]
MRTLCYELLLFLLCLLSSKAGAQNIHSLTLEDGLSDGSVYTVLRDTTGFVWIGTARGVDRFDGSRVVNTTFSDPSDLSENNHVVSIREDGREHLLVQTVKGWWRLDKRRLTLSRLPEGEHPATASRRSATTSSPMGVAAREAWNTEKGCFRFQNSILDFFDETGVFWRCYKFFGLDHTDFSTHLFHTFSVPGVYDSEGVQVRSFLCDGSCMLIGTREGLVVVDTLDNSFVRIGCTELGSTVITHIMRQGPNYYVATVGGGIRIIHAQTLKQEGSLLNGAAVYQLLVSNGCLWACTSMGVGRWRISDVTGTLTSDSHLFTTDNSQLPDNEVLCMAFSPHGDGLISTLNGLCAYISERNALSVKDVPEKLQTYDMLHYMAWTSDDELLVVPYQGVPMAYHGAKRQLRKLLPDSDDDNPYLQFLSIPSKFLPHGFAPMSIVIMSDGIALFDGKSLRRFSYLDGLGNHEMQSRAAYIDDHGRFWAATNGGLVYADIPDLLQSDHPHIAITLQDIQTDHWYTDVEVNNVMMDSLLCLSRHDNTFTVSFLPLVTGNTRDLRYRYRLEGYENTWHIAGHDCRISYSSLRVGSYTLVIEAIGRPEICLHLPVSVPLTHFALVLIVLFLLLVSLIAHIAYCRLNKKEYFWQRLLPKPEKYQKSRMDQHEGEELSRRLLELMENEKPFLRPDLQMADLAKSLGCSSHVLSQVFTQFIRRSYYDFIAEYRIAEFKRRAVDPAYSRYTITALAELCGFRSRNPFLVAFKKFTGVSPKQWMKEHADTQQE